MANPFRSAARKASTAFRGQTKKTLKQAGGTAENNADLMAATFTNADRDTEISSLVGNPAEAQELERWGILENVLARATSGITLLSDSIQKELTPALLTLTGRGLSLLDTAKVLPLVSLDIATQNAKLGPIKLNGWSLQRLAEPFALIAKNISFHAETCVNAEAPFIKMVASASTVIKSSLINTRSDVLWDVTRDYIGRISNTFFVESSQFVALASQKIKLESNSTIDISAGLGAPGAGISLGSTGAIDILGSNTTQSSLVSHTIAAGTSVSISSGIINLNPVVPISPKAGPVVLPISPLIIVPDPVTGSGGTAKAGFVPQYQGQLGSGVVLI